MLLVTKEEKTQKHGWEDRHVKKPDGEKEDGRGRRGGVRPCRRRNEGEEG